MPVSGSAICTTLRVSADDVAVVFVVVDEEVESSVSSLEVTVLAVGVGSDVIGACSEETDFDDAADVGAEDVFSTFAGSEDTPVLVEEVRSVAEVVSCGGFLQEVKTSGMVSVNSKTINFFIFKTSY